MEYKQQYNVTPIVGGTVSLSVTSTSSNILMNASGSHVSLRNAGTKTAFMRFGTDNTVAAVLATDFPLLAGEVFRCNKSDYTYLAGISSGSDTTTVYVSSED